MRTFLWYFIIVKICVNFSIIRFYFSVQIFFMVYRFTIKFLFDTILTFLKISLYFSNNSSSHIKKDMYSFSSKSLLYALIFGINMHKDLTFSASLQPTKYLKPLNILLATKQTLLDTPILLISIFFTEQVFYIGENFVYRFQYHQILYLFFSFLYIISKFFVFVFKLCFTFLFKLEFLVNLQLCSCP